MKICPLCGNSYGGHEGVFIDEHSREVFIDGETIPLSPRLVQTLAGIVKSSPRLVTRDYLMDYIYGLGSIDEPNDKIIDTFICLVRRQIKHTRFEIQTVKTLGYRWRQVSDGPEKQTD